MRRAQSAIEYLITYAWAILIISVAVSFLYFYVLQPTIVAPGTCSFSSQVTCKDIVLGANAVTGSANIIVVLANSQQYPIQNPQIMVNTNGINTTNTPCSPGFVPAGGNIICQVGIPNKLSLNSFLSGKLYLNVLDCGFGANYTAIMACTSPVKETYVGVFSAHAQLSTPAQP